MLLESEVSRRLMDECDEGFAIFGGILSNRECDELLVGLSETLEKRGRAGTRHLMNNSFVAAIAADSRLIDIATRSLGRHVVPYRVTLFEKTSRANWLVVWHQDTALPLSAPNNSPDWGPWSKKDGVIYAHAPAWALARVVALRIHLDPSTQENGALRVIPGTHGRGVLSDEEVFAVARKQEPVNCLVPRGGVLAMRPLLVHSSSKSEGNAPRRVLHIEYADSLDLNPEIKLAVA